MKAPVERLLDQVEWLPLPPNDEPGDLPYATHEGILRIGDLELKCYTLNTGARVFEVNDLLRFFGAKDA